MPDLFEVLGGDHAAVRQMLNEVGKLGGPEHEFDALIDTIIPSCRAHIEFEETRVWPGLRRRDFDLV